MPSAPLRHLIVRTGPVCDGASTFVGGIEEILAATLSETAAYDDQLQVKVPFRIATALGLRKRHVLRCEFVDETFSELRVHRITTHDAPGERVTTIDAASLLLDLAVAGDLSVATADGLPVLTVGMAQATVAQMITALILPKLALAGLGYVSLGQMDYAEVRDWSFVAGTSPLAALRSIEREFPGSRLRWIPNGSTGYFLEHRNLEAFAVGELIDVRARKNLLSITPTDDLEAAATRIMGLGLTAEDDVTATIGRNRWRVAAVTPGTLRVTLEDPAGGAGPLLEDGQLVGRYLAPEPHSPGASPWMLIEDTFAASQDFEVESGVIGAARVGDHVTVREGLGTGELMDRSTGTQLSPIRITAVNGGTREVTVDDAYQNQDPIPVDGLHRGWLARILTAVAQPALSFQDALAQQYTVASVAGLQVGDYCCRASASSLGAGPPWSRLDVVGRIEAIDSGMTLVRVSHPFGGANVIRSTGALASESLHVWRAQSPDLVIEDAVSATNLYTLSSVAGVSVGQTILCVQRVGGELMRTLASPSGQAQYGWVERAIRTERRGEANLILNGYTRAWDAGDTVPPTGFTMPAGPFKGNGLRDTVQTRYGGSSVRLRFAGSAQLAANVASGATTALVSRNIGGWFDAGDSVLISRGLGNEETRTLDSVTDVGFAIELGWSSPLAQAHTNGEVVEDAAYSATAQGSLVVGSVWLPSVLGADQFTAVIQVFVRGLMPGHPVTVRFKLEDLDVAPPPTDLTTTLTEAHNELWTTLTFTRQSPRGAKATLSIEATRVLADAFAWDHAIWVDVVALMQTPYAPERIPEHAWATELWQDVNAKLRVTREPPKSYRARVLDLQRADGHALRYETLQRDALLSLAQPDVPATILRVVTVDSNLLVSRDTEITLGSRGPVLADFFSEG